MTKGIIAGAAALAIFGIVAPASAEWPEASTFGFSFGSPSQPSGVSASAGAKHGVSGHANQFPGVAGREKQRWGRAFEGPLGPNHGNEQWHRDRWCCVEGQGSGAGGGSSPGIDSHGDNVGDRQVGQH